MRISDAFQCAVLRALPLALTVVGPIGAAIAPAAAQEPLTAFFEQNPRYEVLPAPYFESAASDASYLDLELRPYAFLPRHSAWYAEIDTGVVQRVPAAGGASTAKVWKGFLSLGDRPISKVEVRLYAQDRTGAHLVSRIPLSAVRKTRFSAHYQRGPRAKQVATGWGEDGAWMVLIQGRYAPAFWRVPEPVVYVGGDFLYQRVEGLVRYLRTHGVNAWGFKPDFSRDADESLLEMTQNDWPVMRRFLERIDERPAHLVGLCLGGIHARGLAHLEHEAPGGRRLIGTVTSVGAPHRGSELADLYNAIDLVPQVHRLLTGDPNVHKYKDDRPAMADFNRRIPLTPGVPHLSVVLNAHRVGIDRRYLESDWIMRLMRAQELGVSPAEVETDGLILVEGQAFGEVASRWETDHAGMINDGRSSTHFDAYRAHLALVEQLHQRHRPQTPWKVAP